MAKKEMLKTLEELENIKGVHIEGVSANSNKATIQNAINCLNCPDDMLEKYLIVVSLKYEATGKVIAENGDFKRHPFNRLYVYNVARQILAD